MRLAPALLAASLSLAACSPAKPPASDTSAGAGAGAESTQAVSVASSSKSVTNLTEELAPSSAATDGTCLSDIGKVAADRLVKRCIMVSPATHPPCNTSNPCDMIQDEIDRSCAMYGPEEKKPAECTA
ncbi:hypothetical protein [Asticcacaulis benevestitus]|uniref:Secreted protein n=1 Tax=Asticcacaulis benevestitus DSM 16100 = ATCC BAA-896 TaxID=1121022 RepID=V4PK95_9CAUL|nr:hypothetical protein [Asticcacaulis benevestitus]ESQ94407.1 hypothetical protein ABENE_02555 [Asticcacaulis benevestitus DSM 16100 = ATCC BAA-896]